MSTPDLNLLVTLDVLLADGSLSTREVRDQVVTFIVAGHETVASALTWCWFALGEQPSVADALAAEALQWHPPGSPKPAEPGNAARLTWASAVFDESLRLYPVPDAIYTIRLAGVFVAAAPATDGETGNPWMTTAERLIRSRAKLELAIHVLQDQGLASAMGEATAEAWRDLKARTNTMTGSGRVRPMPF